jgi:hypothetical protein
MNNYYKPGDWNAICDRCGFKFKASQLKEDWQGLRVCAEDFETRHPMDFLRVKEDKIGVPWTRLEPNDDTVIETIGTPLGTEYLGLSYIGRV